MRTKGGKLASAGNGNAEALAPRAGFGSDPGFGFPADPVRIMSNLCHELRTPLLVLGGYLDILAEDFGKQFSAEPLRILERLRLNAAELTQTVENLLEYAAAMAGTQAPVAVEAVDVAELIAELEPVFTPAAQRKKLSLQWKIGPHLNHIRSDRRLLKSIISNLVCNAIKFTDRGAVTVDLRHLRVEKCVVELQVVDTGIGLDERRLEDAFQPFVQLSDSNTRIHRGLGLGLALVRRNVTSLGGTIEVKSKPSSGTCVKIRFAQGLRV